MGGLLLYFLRLLVGDGDFRFVFEVIVDKQYLFLLDIVVVFVGVLMLLLKGVVKFLLIYFLFVCLLDMLVELVLMLFDFSFLFLFIGEVFWLCMFIGNGLFFCLYIGFDCILISCG